MALSLLLPQHVERGVVPDGLKPAGGSQAVEPGFADHVKEFVASVDNAERTSDAKVAAVADGKDNDIHGTMVAMEHANIQLRLMGTVRNKVIDAYREVMRMGA